jgi:hypothetical protein
MKLINYLNWLRQKLLFLWEKSLNNDLTPKEWLIIIISLLLLIEVVEQLIKNKPKLKKIFTELIEKFTGKKK